jgi:hypothetical protein
VTEKKLKIVFDPAVFEQFDGSQEELDNLMKEITDMFENKTPEEIKAMSRPVDWDALDDDEAEHLERVYHNHVNNVKPPLQ